MAHTTPPTALLCPCRPSTAIAGSTTLVVGFGSIGQDYAAKMTALGSRVYGIRRHKTACPDWLAGLDTLQRLDEWLPLAHIVALCLPGTPETNGLFDAGQLGRMKPGGILLNGGRGSSVCTDALVNALQAGPLAVPPLGLRSVPRGFAPDPTAF